MILKFKEYKIVREKQENMRCPESCQITRGNLTLFLEVSRTRYRQDWTESNLVSKSMKQMVRGVGKTK